MANNQIIGHIIHEAVTESDCNIVAEKNGKAYGTGIIQDLEIENRNTRIYTKEKLMQINLIIVCKLCNLTFTTKA